MDKIKAPADWYDGKLIDASLETKTDESGNECCIIELKFDVGERFFPVKESIWMVSPSSGDPQKDEMRAQWRRDAIARVKDVYPECVDEATGNIILTKLTMADESVLAKPVRVKVTDNGDFQRAKVFSAGNRKPRVSKDEALKMAAKHSRELMKCGVQLEASAVAPSPSTPINEADIPF